MKRELPRDRSGWTKPIIVIMAGALILFAAIASELAGKGFGQDLQDFLLNFSQPTDQHLGGLLLPAVQHMLPAVQHETVDLLGVAPPDHDHGVF